MEGTTPHFSCSQFRLNTFQYSEGQNLTSLVSDASEDTLCAVANLRSQLKDYSANLAFVIGKCIVAQMRHISIPRLEMQAAVLVMKLKGHIVKEHEIKIHNCSFCSDLTTVWQGIHSSHGKEQKSEATEWLRY